MIKKIRLEIYSNIRLKHGVNAPEELSLSLEDWQQCYKRVERFMFVSGYSEKSEKVHVATLVYTMETKTQDFSSSFSLSATDMKNVAFIVTMSQR